MAVDAFLVTPRMRERGLEPHRVSQSNTTDLYWTLAQLVAHHTSGGCDLRAGDLFGTGTISGPSEAGWGSLREPSPDGQPTIRLASGGTRPFLADGHEAILPPHCPT